MTYQLNVSVMTGYPELDSIHQDIADLSNALKQSLEQEATFADVYAIYEKLQAALIAHFDLEEGILARMPQNTEIRAHRRRHKESHDRFRDVLIYASEQFEQARATSTIPSVAQLIPQDYFDELMDVDGEMKTLMNKYGP